MRSSELKRAKRAARQAAIARRDAMPEPERVEAGRRAVERFLALEELATARTVAAFWSFGSEVPTPPLLEALHGRGIRVALPRIAGSDLELRTWVPGDPMVLAAFGAREPAGGSPVALGEVDVVCTPGVVFDHDGRRVGYGGGFYDRLFDAMGPRAVRVAIAFDLQVVGGPLPEGSFDRRVDAIVTSSRVLRTGTRG
jgi:5-formyltetrahydrofolate cyclo-ligase